MEPSELIAALIDARLFELDHEVYVAESLAKLGVKIGFASEIEVPHERL